MITEREKIADAIADLILPNEVLMLAPARRHSMSRGAWHLAPATSR